MGLAAMQTPHQLDPARCAGSHDVLLLTLDTLRYDVAQREAAEGGTPHLASLLPDGAWERRHAPANFTYPAHQAFFAGFLPTPVTPGPHPRPLALAFPGSETTTSRTWVLDGANIVQGLRQAGYHTVCIGGVGFFNKLTPLGSVLPEMFAESHWDQSMGVTDAASTSNQVRLACQRLDAVPRSERVFLFLNVSAIHQPNRLYVPGADRDTIETHAAALRYVDSQLPPLFAALRRRGPTLAIICSDHGTAYGEDGHRGHRVNHSAVLDVPYAELILEAAA